MKDDLRRYLQAGREAVVSKLDGLGDYDVRRPLVPTGTNLLGLVKHLAGVEAGYLGDVFARPLPSPPAWFAEIDTVPHVDVWATEDESREEVVGLYRTVWAHADATVAELALDATGQVPWWPEDRRTVTLHCVLVHVATETHRHAGHADIVRELVDGTAGRRSPGDNLPPGDAAFWRAHHDRVEQAARTAGGLP